MAIPDFRPGFNRLLVYNRLFLVWMRKPHSTFETFLDQRFRCHTTCLVGNLTTYRNRLSWIKRLGDTHNPVELLSCHENDLQYSGKLIVFNNVFCK